MTNHAEEIFENEILNEEITEPDGNHVIPEWKIRRILSFLPCSGALKSGV